MFVYYEIMFENTVISKNNKQNHMFVYYEIMFENIVISKNNK
jgi:hypothetical protein